MALQTFLESVNTNKFLGIEYHDTLNPKLWTKDERFRNQYKPELIRLAHRWMQFARLPEKAIRDITLVGGNCNYNYAKSSDLDLHILVDFSEMPFRDPDIMHEYIMGKKNEWSKFHPDCQIAGYPVEIYAQSLDEVTPRNQGVWSLTHDQWKIRPTNLHLDFAARDDLVAAVKGFMSQIDNMNDLETARQLKDQIKQMRSDSLRFGHEFANGTLIFKSLRNRGYLEKLSDWIKEHE